MMIYRDPNSPTVSIFHWNADETGKLSYAGAVNGGTHAYWDSVIDSPVYKGKAFVGDFNGDGKTDLMMIYRDPNSPTVSIYHWNADPSGKLTFAGTGGGGTHAYWDSVIDSPIYKGKAFVGDFNGDGKTDLMMIYRDPNSPQVSIYHWNAIPPAADSLSNINSSQGRTLTLTLKPLSGGADYVRNTDATYPAVDVQAPFYVVSSVSSSNALGGTLTTNYKYGGLKAEVGTGRGLLGFAWTQATSVETGITVRTDYRQDWPYIGLPSQIKKTISSGGGPNNQLSLATYTYACLNPALGSACTVATGNRYFPYASLSVESNWDLNGAVLPTVTTANQFDSYGNATQVVVSTGDGYSKTTNNTYTNDVPNWFLGRLTRSTVQSTTP
jgi:hypothetical protein